MKYFDTHCHLNGKFYKDDIKDSIESANKNGVSHILLPGTSVEDSFKGIEIAKKYKNVFAAIGIHPSDSGIADLSYLNNIDPNNIVAVGEIGIDLYWEDNPPLKTQQNVFIKHIEFAIKHDKPIIIHMRNSEKEVYEIIKKYDKLKFVMHSYTGDEYWVKKFLDLGAYISFSGIVTFKNAIAVQNIAKIIPINKIICETDSPFLTPTPNRGKPNRPEFVKYTIEFISKLRPDVDNIQEIIFNNSISFFNL